MKRAVLAGLGVLALAAQPTLAADIPVRMPVKAPVMAPVVYNWTGFYIGAHAGYAWARTRTTDTLGYNTIPGDTWTYKSNGFIGGGQLGYNWQTGGLVFGLEADLGYLGLSGSARAPAGVLFFAGDTVGETKSDFYATVRGRLGFAIDNWLLYATGGWIGVNTRVSVIDACFVAPCGFAVINATDKSFRSGWTVGGGVEVSVGGPWTVKAEYLYFDLGSQTVAAPAFFPPAPAPTITWPWATRTDGHIVRAGFNYRFDAGPVVARY
jgi:outer membrane immunogenic protein